MKIIGIEEDNTKQQRRKRNFIIGVIIFIAIIILILTIVYMANRDFRNFMDEYVLMKNVMEDSVSSIPLDESNTNTIYAYDKYIAILSRKQVSWVQFSRK